MSVGEICNREVIVIDQEENISDAARLMRKHHVGNVVVVRQSDDATRVPVGILTDRDIVIELLARDVDPDALSVGDAMSYDLLTLNENDEVDEAIKQLRARGVRRAPVVNGRGELAGILAVDDIVELLSEQLSDLVELLKREQQVERQRHP
ncbi:CBS domain-containing protein [Marinobacterium nitratireducens]|uniref:CBS domain-containing protein n=1 Tax=Marinobacterium nitratireducens TaxID=518897 RepID=A0A918DUW7_9GAMM|nr:CBS domain-containing protein [Marinobacterium nitratireducens]GGO82979.1 CBS domain-containing protein [Marinobacterium nitratireducens]